MPITADNKETGPPHQARHGGRWPGGGFIGAVHRYAARLDDYYELVAGALAVYLMRAKASGEDLGLAPDRIYSDFATMARIEAGRADGIEAVSIVTPNHLHVPVAMAFIESGIHVICDKPLAISLEEARKLENTAHPQARCHLRTDPQLLLLSLIRQARAMVQSGAGDIRVIQAEYSQDWLTNPIEQDGSAAGRMAH